MDQKTKDLIVLLLVGLAAGFIAHVLLGGGGGLFRYLISGLLGAIVGPFILNALNVNLNLGTALVNRIASAAIGAIVVVILARIIG